MIIYRISANTHNLHTCFFEFFHLVSKTASLSSTSTGQIGWIEINTGQRIESSANLSTDSIPSSRAGPSTQQKGVVFVYSAVNPAEWQKPADKILTGLFSKSHKERLTSGRIRTRRRGNQADGRFYQLQSRASNRRVFDRELGAVPDFGRPPLC